jgi:hypothetical protein
MNDEAEHLLLLLDRNRARAAAFQRKRRAGWRSARVSPVWHRVQRSMQFAIALRLVRQRGECSL